MVYNGIVANSTTTAEAGQMERSYYKGTWQEGRSFSPAVTTKGGTVVWVAGHGAPRDADGKSLAGDFEAQTRESFRLLEETLGRAGARLQDMVTMTVFIGDSRYGTRFTEIRSEYFPDGFPASALITCAGFAQPEMMVEIQGVAVIDD
jgi:2-iminobutanoate/2-iminopropanoate deaminase